MSRAKTVLSFSAFLLALALCGWQRGLLFSQPAAVPFDDSVVSFRVRLGVTDTTPRAWDGSLSITAGEVLGMRNWRPRPGDRIQGHSWSLATRKGPNFVRRPWDEPLLRDATHYVLIPGLIVDTRPNTTVQFKTSNGDFAVNTRELESGAPLSLLGGSVVVDLAPTAQMVSSIDYQNDFASALSGDGEIWIAWVAYRNHGDEIFVRRFNGKSWENPMKVTLTPSDVFLAKLGRDRKGRLWIVWSAQVNSNWDLYGRHFDGKSWSNIERLTDDPQPDIYHNVATDAAGNLWVVWQGFRDGKSDIFARRYDGAEWSAAERVSISPANDWEPAIAADRAGRVYVAWDTYDKGNYDVMLRQYANGQWSDVSAIAATPKFEAHVSLACDDRNRLWAAWNESGFEWGKDTGYLVKLEGTRLYQSRSIGLAVYSNGAWQEPLAGLDRSLPRELATYNDFPIVQNDGAGRMWVFFRHRTLRLADTPSSTPAHRAAWEIFGATYQGAGWSAPVQIPFSQGRTDMRGGFASDGRGHLYAAWATDNRDFEDFLFQRADLYAGRIPLPARTAEPELRARHIPELNAFPIHTREAEDLARIHSYSLASGGRTYHIYRGDTHRHTEFSMDGNNDGTLPQTYRYAIDAAQLDYLGVSDHNGLGGPDIDYINWLEQQMADIWMLPRTFTPLYAYERSVVYPNGHRNVLFAQRGNPTLPIPVEEDKARVGAKALYAYLKQYKGIAISHTSATGMGTDWRDNDPQVEPLVEIYQGDRVSAEYEGAPKAANRDNPASAPGGFRPAGYVWNAWAKGYKLGVQSASDHLSTHISYACTIATDFTREGLLDAMRQRHSYGATDNIILDYRLQSGGSEYLQGDIVKASGEFQLSVKVIGTADIRQIDVIRNNKFIHNRQPLTREASFTFVDNQPSAGESYYYVRVIQADDQMAWSSPIWVIR